MKKGEQSKKRLVDTTAALLQRQGFHATGLAQIVKDSGAPRGSLYFYFPGGKEELACTALDESGAAVRAQLEAIVDAAPDAGSAAALVCRALADRLVATDFQDGCPLATVALEAAASSEAVRNTVAAHYRGWQELIAARLTALGVTAADATAAATFTLSAIEGALLLARVQRQRAPLDTVGDMLARLFADTLGDRDAS